MTGPQAPVEAPPDVPDLQDALPGARWWQQRAVRLLSTGRPATEVDSAIVGLLEAAGGPDVGNTVRSHLERIAAAPTVTFARDDPWGQVLTAALQLYLAADTDVRASLAAAGLAGAADIDERRQERAAYALRVLTGRRAAVLAVLELLADGSPIQAQR